MNKKGVTLIELIVVMVIIAIGAILLVPNIGAWLPNYRLKKCNQRYCFNHEDSTNEGSFHKYLEYRVDFNSA